MPDDSPHHPRFIDQIRANKKLFLCEGIAFTFLGLFALFVPTLFSLTLDYCLGWVLVIGSIVLGMRIIKAGPMPHRTISILSTFLYLFLGFMFLAYPISGIMTLILLLGCFFILDGAEKIHYSFLLRPMKSWKMVLFSGIISLILAFLILISWPTEVPWVLGVVVGINFLSTGLTTIRVLWNLGKV